MGCLPSAVAARRRALRGWCWSCLHLSSSCSWSSLAGARGRTPLCRGPRSASASCASDVGPVARDVRRAAVHRTARMRHLGRRPDLAVPHRRSAPRSSWPSSRRAGSRSRSASWSSCSRRSRASSIGLWGLFVFMPDLVKPLGISIATDARASSRSSRARCSGPSRLAAGLILAIMILPTITALIARRLHGGPGAQREASLALGATRWETLCRWSSRMAGSGIFGADHPGPRPCPR